MYTRFDVCVFLYMRWSNLLKKRKRPAFSFIVLRFTSFFSRINFVGRGGDFGAGNKGAGREGKWLEEVVGGGKVGI